MKKIKALLLVFLVAGTFLFANGTSESNQSNMVNQTREFTDSLGRVVSVDKNIERMAPSGKLAQIILYTMDYNRMVGWSSRPSSSLESYFDKDVLDLPIFGTFYGAKANLNMEAVISANPQIVIDLGEIKGSKEEMIKDLDTLQDNLGIPVVFIEAYLDDMGTTFRMLGDLLDLEEEGEAKAQLCEATIARANEAQKLITDKTTIYFGVGQDGLTSYPKNSFRTQTLRLAGLENVVEGKGNNIIVSPEQLIIWNPDVIIVDQEGSYEKFTAPNSPFSEISAVKNNRVYEIPEGPFSWIDNPPSVNRILGIDWIGNLIYPEAFDLDITSEAKTFYDLFYHYSLSDAEAAKLMINSKN